MGYEIVAKADLLMLRSVYLFLSRKLGCMSLQVASHALVNC